MSQGLSPSLKKFGLRTSQAFVAGVSALLFVVLVGQLIMALSGPLTFDDAYMFYRYALNLGEGRGLSWNPDGVPTYGLTSRPWALVILPFTWLPLQAGAALQIASWMTGMAGLALVAFTALRHKDQHEWNRKAVALSVLFLAVNPAFAFQLTTGMDTMLSFLANAALMLALLGYLARPRLRQALAVGLVAFTAVLIRPDNALCALGAPLMAWALKSGGERRLDLLGLICVPALLIGLDLVVSRWYFGVPLPLGFYAKSARGYVGFQNHENPIRYMLAAAPCTVPFLALAIAGLSSRQRYLLAACLIPLAATVTYLFTVRQVMGMAGRYYIPFLPYLAAPALLSAGAAWARDGKTAYRTFMKALTAGLLLFAALIAASGMLEKAYLKRTLPRPVSMPALPVTASEPLPSVPWFEAITRLAEDVAADLPSDAILAASEVGYLGASAPHVTLIDLVGLNDTVIGRNGFSFDDLLARAPDLIWLPHWDYTGLRAAILADPRFHDRYQVIVGAFNYGLAIRRDSPHRVQIESNIAQAWTKLYPAYGMKDFVVHTPSGF
ncbi:hypothetical protein DC522_00855 [Microvirga sp. KLBC 81]|uniref:hypothetical protein n=1 Tax=Microvirga sp. KLBC 81 TaxID=1862707 RepID=UPI000D50DC8D|nr:hypothetical protein [Microvirga sp. KLBC 81]PVE26342.1 hypothetical protein DC522_00855 [Microvirga sp. KLBC 81]